MSRPCLSNLLEMGCTNDVPDNGMFCQPCLDARATEPWMCGFCDTERAATDREYVDRGTAVVQGVESRVVVMCCGQCAARLEPTP